MVWSMRTPRAPSWRPSVHESRAGASKLLRGAPRVAHSPRTVRPVGRRAIVSGRAVPRRVHHAATAHEHAVLDTAACQARHKSPVNGPRRPYAAPPAVHLRPRIARHVRDRSFQDLRANSKVGSFT